ncbi:hypothetical protein COW36_12920 [bacterium (Candidatus Blackallbacteria) CG17_big_fil_post_rev_8_21_14_2_50_48_46]|uniref:Knr4/Smi1-like domain-containing protein n=1 Tax=bacterium (Candidatus Blackallbacteria) CG17_big_fil_post_rev_8_21_14_2_50_48_46 TaxID=2014261 RepID=A0A2M7G4J2_9BACT|nr:MAG: hypothetical protein COW64_02345 [bacterium (Candidatus Blackallbacteria) CG18_big_fil_WC_8_21_14_2_50_49_26]PIW16661.1 MAG: hypothetical protein COW36_12920 [bacterium (Candidatus Blackallbacteria) CG17_big_fil_post_rev_8_21_14_2_50_48_46]PIW46167.1 MAG: hypothetical protein COW20_18175 [bacterium (Candidatus Blackallbacteria) CG13_big_fil_rev_8_21_14_2_50_49_14]
MYDWLRQDYETLTQAAELAPPATENEIEALEKALNLKLPPALSQFLRIANGARSWGVYGEIYSTQRIREQFDEWGFLPWSGALQLLDPDFEESHYYSQRPGHFLMIAQSPQGADCYCLDTYALQAEEWRVCYYDAEFEVSDHLRPRFQDFEAFLLAGLDGVLEQIEDESLLEDANFWAAYEGYVQQSQEENQAFLEHYQPPIGYPQELKD